MFPPFFHIPQISKLFHLCTMFLKQANEPKYWFNTLEIINKK